jgi:hypothetical protein
VDDHVGGEYADAPVARLLLKVRTLVEKRALVEDDVDALGGEVVRSWSKTGSMTKTGPSSTTGSML